MTTPYVVFKIVVLLWLASWLVLRGTIMRSCCCRTWGMRSTSLGHCDWMACLLMEWMFRKLKGFSSTCAFRVEILQPQDVVHQSPQTMKQTHLLQGDVTTRRHCRGKYFPQYCDQDLHHTKTTFTTYLCEAYARHCHAAPCWWTTGLPFWNKCPRNENINSSFGPWQCFSLIGIFLEFRSSHFSLWFQILRHPCCRRSCLTLARFLHRNKSNTVSQLVGALCEGALRDISNTSEGM